MIDQRLEKFFHFPPFLSFSSCHFLDGLVKEQQKMLFELQKKEGKKFQSTRNKNKRGTLKI